MPTKCLLAIVLAVALGACSPSEESKSPTPQSELPSLPLSPGVRIASLTSGGIAGISDLIQLTDDWNLILVSDGNSVVRHLDGEEQKLINAALQPFQSLLHEQRDDFPDGFSSILVARGTGEGEGTAEQAAALAKVLAELKAAPQ
jgi:hypothetical protein